MIYAVIFAFAFGAALGFVAGAGWRAMFSGPFPVAVTDTDTTDTYPGTGTDIESWGYADERGTD
jgi:hypothetical protein